MESGAVEQERQEAALEARGKPGWVDHQSAVLSLPLTYHPPTITPDTPNHRLYIRGTASTVAAWLCAPGFTTRRAWTTHFVSCCRVLHVTLDCYQESWYLAALHC